MLKLTKVTISNIMGIQELEFTPGSKLTWIRARNGTAKSSIINSLQAAIGGGTDVRLVRKGSERGEVALLFDDPAGGRETSIARSIRADGKGSKTPKVSTPDVPSMPSPQSFIEGLLDLRSTNPLKFLELGDRKEDREERAKWLLESLPMALDLKELSELSGLSLQTIEDLGLAKKHPLEALRKAEDILIEKRKEAKRQAEDAEATVRTLAATSVAIPAGEVSDTKLAELRKELLELEASHAQRKQANKEEASATIAENESRRKEAVAKAQIKRDEAIAVAMKIFEAAKLAAMQEFQSEVNSANDSAASAINPIREVERSQADAIDAECAPAINNARVAVERMERALQDMGRYQESQAQQKKFNDTAQGYRSRANSADEALTRLDRLRKRLMEQNQLPDVEIRDGDIFIEGVEWVLVNTAKRMDVAIQLAELRAGKVGLICVDGIERLEEDSQRLFVERALNSGHQYIVTEAVPGDLDIAAVDDIGQFELVKDDNEERRKKSKTERTNA